MRRPLTLLLALALSGCGGVGVGPVEPWWPSAAQQEPAVHRLILTPTQTATLRRWGGERAQEEALPVGRQGEEVSRALLRFDLSALPIRARVHAARLWVTTREVCPTPPQGEPLWLRASPVAQPWRAERLRWEDAPAPLEALARRGEAQPGGADAFDLTEAVRAWSKGALPNHGVELRLLHEGQRACKSYHTGKHGTVAQAPRLHIEYSVPTLR